MYGKQYVWFLIGWYEDDWYTFMDKGHNCTVQQMKEAVEGHLTTEALMLNQGSEPTLSRMVNFAFKLHIEIKLFVKKSFSILFLKRFIHNYGKS